MRWILRSLAIAVASVLLFGGANKPAYAQLDTGMQSTLNAASASGNATVIAIVMANAAASGNQAAMNAVAAAVIGSGNPSLIASVIGSNLIAGGAGGAAIGTALAGTGNATLIGQVIAAAPPAAANNVISVVGAAVAGSPNAMTLAPAVVTRDGRNWRCDLRVAIFVAGDAIISSAGAGSAVAAMSERGRIQPAAVVPTTVAVNDGVRRLGPAAVPPPCTTSCSLNPWWPMWRSQSGAPQGKTRDAGSPRIGPIGFDPPR